MSCTFWIRRHKAAAKKRAEEARLKAEAEKKATKKNVVEKQATEEKVFNEEPVVEVKKPRKKAVNSDDNAPTV